MSSAARTFHFGPLPDLHLLPSKTFNRRVRREIPQRTLRRAFDFSILGDVIAGVIS